jgi:hypothetical protein
VSSIVGSGRLRGDQEDRGTTQLREGETTVGVTLTQGTHRNVDAPQDVTRREDVPVISRHEVGGIDGAFGSVGIPERVRRLQRDGQRDHRAGRQ